MVTGLRLAMQVRGGHSEAEQWLPQAVDDDTFTAQDIEAH